MDANKEEADACIEKAINYLRTGDREKAEKFLIKANNMYPSSKAEVLLAKLKVSSEDTTDSSDKPKAYRRRQSPQASPKTQRTKSPERNYTREQVEGVARIKKCKNFYEILGVTKEATDSEIKKSYKRLALQFHPDKNHAPGAAEAFKHIGNAAATLTDAEKRKQYDMFESEETQRYGRGYQRRTFEGAYTRGFAGDDTAEELFNMFFNGYNTAYMRHNRPTRHEYREGRGDQHSGFTPLLNLLPILILIIVSMMSSLFISEAVYSLQPGSKYTVMRKTNSLRVPYYVKDNFHTDYQGSIKRLEASVEEEYIHNLKSTCYKEKSYKDSMKMRAHYSGDRSLFERAKTLSTPACDLIGHIQTGGTVS